MTDTIESLRAEVARLRDMLEENGIDPEPYIAPPPQFGPPTLQQYHMNLSIARMVQITLSGPIWSWGADATPGHTLRVRLPTDYAVKPRA